MDELEEMILRFMRFGIGMPSKYLMDERQYISDQVQIYSSK